MGLTIGYNIAGAVIAGFGSVLALELIARRLDSGISASILVYGTAFAIVYASIFLIKTVNPALPETMKIEAFHIFLFVSAMVRSTDLLNQKQL